MPNDRPERFAKGTARSADAIALGLEDSVARSWKDAGREAIPGWLAGLRDGMRVLVLLRVGCRP